MTACVGHINAIICISDSDYVAMDRTTPRTLIKTTQSVSKRAIDSFVYFLKWAGEPLLIGFFSQALIDVIFPTESMCISLALSFTFGSLVELICCIVRALKKADKV